MRDHAFPISTSIGAWNLAGIRLEIWTDPVYCRKASNSLWDEGVAHGHQHGAADALEAAGDDQQGQIRSCGTEKCCDGKGHVARTQDKCGALRWPILANTGSREQIMTR